jgi:chromate reductase
MRILAVSGSLRADSHNTSLLRAAIDEAPEGVEVELWEGLGELPVYDQDLDDDDLPEAVLRLRETWGAADAILFATPEYNGSVPGGLKNAIDWASRPRIEAALVNKNVAVIGASTGQFGAMWAQADLKRILGLTGAIAPAPSVDPFGRERLGLRLESSVDRTHFGVNWNAPNQGGGDYLGTDVKLIAELALVKQEG